VIYFSIDIETTGLNPQTDDVLQIGLVAENSEFPTEIEHLPTLNLVLARQRVTGSPFAMKMNADLLGVVGDDKLHKQLARVDAIVAAYDEPAPKEVINVKDVIGVPGILTTCRGRPAYFIAPKNAFYAVREWLTSVAGTGPHTPAGKNFAGFDLQFLIALDDRFRTLFRHRTLDAGSLLVDWSDQCPASLDLLKQRHLGGGTVAHDAIDDAIDVIRLLRTTYPKAGGAS